MFHATIRVQWQQTWPEDMYICQCPIEPYSKVHATREIQSTLRSCWSVWNDHWRAWICFLRATIFHEFFASVSAKWPDVAIVLEQRKDKHSKILQRRETSTEQKYESDFRKPNEDTWCADECATLYMWNPIVPSPRTLAHPVFLGAFIFSAFPTNLCLRHTLRVLRPSPFNDISSLQWRAYRSSFATRPT